MKTLIISCTENETSSTWKLFLFKKNFHKRQECGEFSILLATLLKQIYKNLSGTWKPVLFHVLKMKLTQNENWIWKFIRLWKILTDFKWVWRILHIVDYVNEKN